MNKAEQNTASFNIYDTDKISTKDRKICATTTCNWDSQPIVCYSSMIADCFSCLIYCIIPIYVSRNIFDDSKEESL